MKLTKSTDFSLRLIIYLVENKGLNTMMTLSSSLDIPYNNLTKLVQKLAKHQFIQTQKGKYGGVQLLKSPEEISLKSVIDLIDGPTMLSECQKNPGLCGLSCDCKLKDVLGDVQEKINQLLADVTIKDIVK